MSWINIDRFVARACATGGPARRSSGRGSRRAVSRSSRGRRRFNETARRKRKRVACGGARSRVGPRTIPTYATAHTPEVVADGGGARRRVRPNRRVDCDLAHGRAGPVPPRRGAAAG